MVDAIGEAYDTLRARSMFATPRGGARERGGATLYERNEGRIISHSWARLERNDSCLHSTAE